jgi:hypothetical protein
VQVEAAQAVEALLLSYTFGAVVHDAAKVAPASLE